jgi:hypothetical protein
MLRVGFEHTIPMFLVKKFYALTCFYIKKLKKNIYYKSNIAPYCGMTLESQNSEARVDVSC